MKKRNVTGNRRRAIAALLVTALLSVMLAGCGGAKEQEALRAGETQAQLPMTTQTTPIEIDVSDSAFSFLPEFQPLSEKENTLLIYMVGSNLESQAQAASRDLLEMTQSGVDPEKTNVVICTGGTLGWWFDIPSDVNTLLRVREDGGISFDAQTDKLQNMGEAQTLADFLTFAAAGYPAKHYSLIFWDHGSGPVQGFCYDEVFMDILELKELKAALGASPFADALHLDWVGFDACLMASIEMAELLSPYTDYLIASQETEAGAGWDYHFLSAFNDNPDKEALMDAILTAYEDYFKENRTLFFNPDVTLSCMDLSKVDDTLLAMDGLFDAMTRDLNEGGYGQLAQYRADMKSFGIAATGGRGNSLDLVDLGDLADTMEEAHPEEARALRQQVEDMVYAQVSNVRTASGISLYYPYHNIDLYGYYGLSLYDEVTGSDGYRDYLLAYTDAWEKALSPKAEESSVFDDMDTGTSDAQGITLKLTKEQIEAADRMTYTVFYESAKDVYTPVVIAADCAPDAEGVIRLSADQPLYAAVTDVADNKALWAVVQLEKEAERARYQTLNAQLHNTYVFTPWGDAQNYQVTFTEEGERLTVQSVELEASEASQGTSVSHSGKGTVDVGSWDYMATTYFRYIPERDTQGRMLPFSEWRNDGWMFTDFLKLDRTFHFERIDKSEIPNRKVVQFIVRDADGNNHASDLLELYDAHLPQETTYQTPNGTMTVQLFEDAATITAYEGTDRELEIPKEIEQRPVTTLSSHLFLRNEALEKVTIPDSVTRMEEGVFYGCSALREVTLSSSLKALPTYAFYLCESLEALTLPHGLEQIGTDALGGTALSSITIPATVDRIYAGAFSDCARLRDIRLESEETYRVVDGVLFSADGKLLHTYPEGLASTYEIPAGTEEIGDYAFCSNETLTRVTYPEGLREIGEFAFFNTTALADGYRFPLSLERIGAGAFDTAMTYGAVEVQEIVIGPNVSEIGMDAFADMNLKAINVVKENPYYASQNGVLTNKAGDTLLYCPAGIEGTYRVPDGIVIIKDRAFSSYSEIEHLILPDSVMIMKGLSIPGDRISVGSGLMEWEGLTNAEFKEIHIAEDNSYFKSEGLIVFNGDRSAILSYPFGMEEEVYDIPDGVREIKYRAFRNQNLKTLNIPSSVETGLTGYRDGNNFTMLTALEKFHVDEKNESCQSIDGILYSKDLERLIAVPPCIDSPVMIHEGTKEISSNAISSIEKSIEIHIPEGVTRLPFMMSQRISIREEDTSVDIYLPESLNEIDESVFSAEIRAIARGEDSVLTVHCKKGSYADTFFRQKGLHVVN